MSDALNYLIEARPEAMTAYFKFIKQAGEHLDPKTRSLISVITKVATQTEKGFKQYLKRALRDGASANEILDALLMAFPVLGLSKTIWAIEQLQEMGLPEFDIEALKLKPQWHDVIMIDELVEGTKKLVCDGLDLFVHKQGEEIKVYDSHCPHQSTSMTELAVENDRLVCPTHHWCFDLNSGDCIEKGNKPLSIFKTQQFEGCLQAWW